MARRAGPGGTRRSGREPAALSVTSGLTVDRRMNKYKLIGKIEEGTLKMLSLRDEKYYACKQTQGATLGKITLRLGEFDFVGVSVLSSHVWNVSPHTDTKHLNAYLQMVTMVTKIGLMSWTKSQKIYEVTGTAANKTLNKFKQGQDLPVLISPLEKEKKYLLLCTICLLYAMIKYQPEERIAAHQALQHPCFQELWQVTSNYFNLED